MGLKKFWFKNEEVENGYKAVWEKIREFIMKKKRPHPLAPLSKVEGRLGGAVQKTTLF